MITRSLLFLFGILMYNGVYSQTQGINYKAIIKDNNGNVIANDLISVQFTILQGTAQTNVYRENHTPTTDANGLIILNIGEGTPVNGTFNTIDWASDATFLNTKINIGAGMVDMGSTEFKTVPYAINAVTAANVTGLETINEGNGIGWRLKGSDPNYFGNIGLSAIDMSNGLTASSIFGATGNYSIAMGAQTTASGIASTAMGLSTEASGQGSTAIGSNTVASGSFSIAMGYDTKASENFATAMGRETIASGFYSTTMGYDTEASGQSSTAMGSGSLASGQSSTAMGINTTATQQGSIAMGQNTTASGFYSTAMGFNTNATSLGSVGMGRFNVGGGNTTSWVATDPLFEIGNGTGDASRSNALTVLKNGTITAPSFDVAEITDPKALITKEYADVNLGGTGLKAINEGNGIGWRLIGRNPNNYGNIGLDAVDLTASNSTDTTLGATGEKSIATGNQTTASGYVSTAIGDFTRASGGFSTAMGSTTTASGIGSTAIGSSTTASGFISTAMGANTTASGAISTAIGSNTIASSYASLAIGRYNVGGGNAESWIALDPLFEVGFGQSSSNKLNALTILKNGKVGIGTHLPTTFLQLTNGYEANFGIGSGFFMIGRDSGTNMVFDNNEILVRNNGAISNLHLQQDGGNVYVGGTLTHSSDRRLKKDIAPLSYGLETILQLNPVAYNWINRTQDRKSLGLIAQEVQPIVGEIVHEDDDEAKTLSVSYTELIPVLIKAIQEQQDIIKRQESKIENLTAESNQKDETMKAFDIRLKQLETVVKVENQ